MIRSGTRLAATTTSVPSVEAGFKAICKGCAALATDSSCSSNPIEEKTSTSGSGCVVVSLKFPLSSVKVPADEPLTVTLTAGTRSLLLELVTLPVIVTEDWGLADKEKRRHKTGNSGAAAPIEFFLIAQVFVDKL
jgi:hypothetical protein